MEAWGHLKALPQLDKNAMLPLCTHLIWLIQVQVYLSYISITLITPANTVCKDHVVKKIQKKRGKAYPQNVDKKNVFFLTPPLTPSVGYCIIGVSVPK